MLIWIPVPLPPFIVYGAAHQLLHPILGPKAPSVADLITFEMSRRNPNSIAEEFLEHHGYPTLRACQRKISAKQAATAKAKSGRPCRSGSKAARRLLASVDPSRN
jgi:hypothetical protein